jgi:hypothetical protein
MTRGTGVRPFGGHVDDLVPVYFAEITSVGTPFWFTYIATAFML